MGKGIANTNDTLDGTIRTHPDPFRIMDAIWMLAAEAKPHTHSAMLRLVKLRNHPAIYFQTFSENS